MMKQTVGKAQSLLEKLSELKRVGKTDEFTLQTIAREAKEIKAEDPKNYLYVMGAVECLRENAIEMRKHYQAAIEAFGGDVVTYYNFASSLYSLGYLAEAKHCAEKGLRLAPTNEEMQELTEDILAALDRQMGDEMETETEEELSRYALYASESALAKVWDDPEEDEAWADL
ncbi:hypothetical protein [Desulfovermiculus halophilus]|jgi:tetratricopeptide (TPR) repeat protein|uniref:hypothetical protein n=1 Tax=Desulfovermiculus halophilus TaxID=339722 RepID=UPI0005562AF2|nr:hypothetical protein [Desulfovermiculus halophilus]